MSVVNTVVAGVKEQDRVRALVNCFATWDGSDVDQSVIADGIITRYRAMGKPIAGLNFRRVDLTSVVVRVRDEAGDEFNILSIGLYQYAEPDDIPYGDKWLHVSAVHPKYFHPHELEVLAVYLIENLYH